MSVEFIISIVRQGLFTAAMVGGPILLTALFIGISISLFQAVTQINEATLTFIPKIIAVGAVFMLMLPWIIGRLQGFMTFIFTNLPNFIK